MRASFCVLVSVGVFSLGCSLFGGGKFKSDVCQQYLDCVAEVEPDALAGLTATYGEEGTCADGSKDERDRCEDVCDSEREDLLEANPFVAECTADGTEPEATTEILLGGSSWDGVLEFIDGTCYWNNPTMSLTIEGDDDEDFTLVFDAEQLAEDEVEVSCVLEDDLSSFTCDSITLSLGTDDFAWDFSNGAFDTDFETFVVDMYMFVDGAESCEGSHIFEAERVSGR